MDPKVQNQSLQQLQEAYKAKGFSDEEITQREGRLIDRASEMFLDQVEAVLTADDLSAIDQIKDDDEAEKEAMKRYREKTGKDPEQSFTDVLNQLAGEEAQRLTASK